VDGSAVVAVAIPNLTIADMADESKTFGNLFIQSAVHSPIRARLCACAFACGVRRWKPRQATVSAAAAYRYPNSLTGGAAPRVMRERAAWRRL
jgi:hypothetical protein